MHHLGPVGLSGQMGALPESSVSRQGFVSDLSASKWEVGVSMVCSICWPRFVGQLWWPLTPLLGLTAAWWGVRRRQRSTGRGSKALPMSVCALNILFPDHIMARITFFFINNHFVGSNKFFSFLNPAVRFLPNKGLKTSLLGVHQVDNTVYCHNAWNLLVHVLVFFSLFLGRKPTGWADLGVAPTKPINLVFWSIVGEDAITNELPGD